MQTVSTAHHESDAAQTARLPACHERRELERRVFAPALIEGNDQLAVVLEGAQQNLTLALTGVVA